MKKEYIELWVNIAEITEDGKEICKDYNMTPVLSADEKLIEKEFYKTHSIPDINGLANEILEYVHRNSGVDDAIQYHLLNSVPELYSPDNSSGSIILHLSESGRPLLRSTSLIRKLTDSEFEQLSKKIAFKTKEFHIETPSE